ncbi:hypothetical protein [Nostoc sp. C117]|uniref:hypothetical protein n=1 Tax=Nostoc sp. C117 TaxID=3349875 RepID=UPI00370D352C
MSDRIAGIKPGADDYVLKPFSIDELLATFRTHLRRRHQTDGADILESPYFLLSNVK